MRDLPRGTATTFRWRQVAPLFANQELRLAKTLAAPGKRIEVES
jgi:hypothetical protein